MDADGVKWLANTSGTVKTNICTMVKNRFHYRYPWEAREMSTSLTDLDDIENETRISVRKRMSSELGFTGVSILHKYLNPLVWF